MTGPGTRLAIGALLFICGTGIFAGVAEGVVTGGSLTGVDASVAAWFDARATPSVTQGMLFFTHLHGTLSVSILALLLAAYLVWRKEGYWVLTLLAVLPVGMLINVLLKQIFLRARPSISDPILTLASYSFPSGHVAGATLFYGVLAAFLCSRLQAWPVQAVIVLCAGGLVVLVAITRLYLGVHYFSDVVAAAAWSMAWVAFCLIGTTALKIHLDAQRT